LFELRVEAGRVVAAGFSGQACAVTKASASLLTEWLPGHDRAEIERGLEAFDQVLSGTSARVAEFLGPFVELRALADFPTRRRNARLPWRCALDALET
jgi:nitrogen fixation NifU-like protein